MRESEARVLSEALNLLTPAHVWISYDGTEYHVNTWLDHGRYENRMGSKATLSSLPGVLYYLARVAEVARPEDFVLGEPRTRPQIVKPAPRAERHRPETPKKRRIRYFSTREEART